MRTLCGTILAAAFAANCLAMEVSFDGRALAVHPVRVSAFPMNQVWAGCQRPIEQTKTAAFVSFDIAKPGVLTVVPSEQKGT